ncbi:MAG: BrnT family toxin [Defluviitaleaceae bacterium]|nr:BrnT family toxin [Defluviitaleaceae bacterium]MCL2273411.1 BrnT family toxin [Defluviitaleaceae bacterium]
MAEYVLGNMVFNWNETKAETNEEKHGVSFEEAATAFRDENAQLYDDEEHSEDEERFILLGYSKISRLLIVCHCYRGNNDDVIRIISARKAEKPERRKYEERVKP